MKLYKGWLRLENDETIHVTLIGTDRTTNNSPYAKCIDSQGQKFNVNIAEKDLQLSKGEYQIHCTNVGINGYSYVEFTEVATEYAQKNILDQWETQDKTLSAEQHHDDIRLDSIRVSLRLTQDYIENIEYTNSTIDEAVETIQGELQKAFGIMMWRREQ